MDPEVNAARVLEMDQFKKDFEQANTRLTVAELVLSRSAATVAQLGELTTAAYCLAQICHSDGSPHRPLDILFWLRNRLEHLAAETKYADVFRAACRRECCKAEGSIRDLCQQLGSGKIVALL